jgi:hypothetical protein
LKPDKNGKRKASPVEDEDDGWFENQSREPPKPTKKMGGIKLTKSQKREVAADSRRSNADVNRHGPPPSNIPLSQRMSSPRRGPPPRNRSPIRPNNRDQHPLDVDSYRPSYKPRPEYRTRDERQWEYEASHWRHRRDEEQGAFRGRDYRR